MDQSYKLIQEGLESFEKSSSARSRPRIWGRPGWPAGSRPSSDRDPDGDKVMMLRFSDSWQFKSQRQGRQPVQPESRGQSFDFSLEGISTVPRWRPSAPWSRDWTNWPASSSGNGWQDPGRQAGRVQLDDSQLVSLLPQAQAVGPLSQAYQGLTPAGGPQAPGGLPATAEQGAAGRCPAADRPAAGVDAGRVGGAGPGRGDGAGFMGFNQRMLEAMQAARPADGRRLPRRIAPDARGRAVCQPAPGLAHCPFPQPDHAMNPKKPKRQARTLLPLHLRDPVPVRLRDRHRRALLPGGGRALPIWCRMRIPDP